MTGPEARSAATFDLRHALAVASRVDGLDAKLVALLHDAVEDGACNLLDLRDADLPDEIVDAVAYLTRGSGSDETYAAYIERIKESGSELAVYVKLADLDTNLSRLDEERASLEGRYRKAVRTLSEVRA